MAVKITKANPVKSTISNSRKGGTKDKQDHETSTLLPLLVLDGDDAKSFLAAIQNLLTTNKAMVAGEEVVVVTASGKEVTLKPTDALIESKVTVPNCDLPTTFVELADSINAAMAQTHRNRMGAWLTKEFTTPAKAAGSKASSDGTISDDLFA